MVYYKKVFNILVFYTLNVPSALGFNTTIICLNKMYFTKIVLFLNLTIMIVLKKTNPMMDGLCYVKDRNL